jgi:glutamine cyclotransferase
VRRTERRPARRRAGSAARRVGWRGLALAPLTLVLAGGACGQGQGSSGDGALAGTGPAASAPASAAPSRAPLLAWRVVARHPHDPAAFTQGLLWHDGRLYESTGGYGDSELRRVALASGSVEARKPLPRHHFGEGLALIDERLVQLTWREGVAWVWSVETLAPLGELRYRGEGWGLARVGDRLLQGDGTARLTWRDAATLQPAGTVTVTDGGREVGLLNELEAVGDRVWANVWQSAEVVRFDPETGRVDARLDLSPLVAEAAEAAAGRLDVLNGIAWRPETGTLLVTGKLWPVLFEIALDEPAR